MSIPDPLKLAEALRSAPFGLSASHASELSRGIKKPSLELAVQIEDEMGIAPRFWIKGAEADEGVMVASSHDAAATSTDKAPAAVGHAAGEVGE
jgi:hypothetical protein